jgi:oxidoreductase
MKPIPIAIIGTGWITQHGYLRHLIKHNGIQVAAAYDTSLACLHKTAHQLGLPERSLSLEACFGSRIEGVLLCTPAYVHSREIAQCIAHGKYILCEKPVCRSMGEIAEAGLATGLEARLMGSAAMRLRKDIGLLLSWVKQGLLGDLRHIHLGWWRERGVPAPGSWRTDPGLSPLGVMEDLGPHLLDMVAALSSSLGWKEARVTGASLRCKYGDSAHGADWFENSSVAQYQVPDQAQARLVSDSGTQIHIEACWATDVPGDCCSIRLLGSRGSASFAGLLGFSTSRRSPDQYCCLQLTDRPVETRHFHTGIEIQQQAFADSIDIFAAFCRGQAAPTSSYSEIRQVAEWLTQIKDAAQFPADENASVVFLSS